MNPLFPGELEQLLHHIILMGERVREMVRLSSRALCMADRALANEVRTMDESVHEYERLIDAAVMHHDLHHGPSGRDMRLMMVARGVGHELELMADQTAMIARRIMVLGERGGLKDFMEVPAMAKLVEAQIRLATDAFVSLDQACARRAIGIVSELDTLNAANTRCVFGPGNTHGSLPLVQVELLFASKGYQRIGDHAKSIAEQVVALMAEEAPHIRSW